jgi:hypothetical protein
MGRDRSRFMGSRKFKRLLQIFPIRRKIGSSAPGPFSNPKVRSAVTVSLRDAMAHAEATIEQVRQGGGVSWLRKNGYSNTGPTATGVPTRFFRKKLNSGQFSRIEFSVDRERILCMGDFRNNPVFEKLMIFQEFYTDGFVNLVSKPPYMTKGKSVILDGFDNLADAFRKKGFKAEAKRFGGTVEPGPPGAGPLMQGVGTRITIYKGNEKVGVITRSDLEAVGGFFGFLVKPKFMEQLVGIMLPHIKPGPER